MDYNCYSMKCYVRQRVCETVLIFSPDDEKMHKQNSNVGLTLCANLR